jgi:hypothetical protein
MNFFVQPVDDKFINNTIISLREMGHNVLSVPVQQDLYKIYYKFPFEYAIFLASKFDNEVAQFISEFCSKGIKFAIYHDDNINNDVLQYYGSVCKSLTNTKHEKCIHVPELINQYLYKSNKQKKEPIVSCFLDSITEIPQELEEYLYPNSNLKLRLFNNPSIKHYQNLGTLNEYDKSTILNQSEYFLSFDGYYSNEAIACGCKVLGTKDLKKIDKAKNKKSKQKAQTYQEFIESNLL